MRVVIIDDLLSLPYRPCKRNHMATLVCLIIAMATLCMPLEPPSPLFVLPVLGQWVSNSAKRAPFGLLGERFVTPVSVPKVPGRYYFLFSSPIIDTSGINLSDKEAFATLYASVQTELELRRLPTCSRSASKTHGRRRSLVMYFLR